LLTFEDELPKLKEITLILKLSLWKSSRMNNASLFQKKIKTDKSSIRSEYRITCGAYVINRHILPDLITVADEESNSYAESDSINSNTTSDDKR
jgi:hypothetical protein